MPSSFDFILDFLTPDYFKKEKKENLREIPPTLGLVTHYDEKQGIIQGEYGDQDGEIQDYNWSFDIHMKSLLNTKIEQRLTEEIRKMLLEPENGSKLMPKSEMSQILGRLIKEVAKRRKILSESSLTIDQTLKAIDNLIRKLQAYDTDLKKDIITRGPKKDVEFRGYRFTDSRIQNEAAVIEAIWSLLIKKKLVRGEDKEAFKSLFMEQWTGAKTIKWLGTPKEFYALYSALFISLIKGENPYIIANGYNMKIQKLLICFEVLEPGCQKRINHKEIKKYNSKSIENPLNRLIRNTVENQLV